MWKPADRPPGSPEPRAGSPRHRRVLQWALIALPAVMLVWASWADRWVADDAYIDFRVVHNLVAGHGPVYNVGERVEVFTDPLWVAILAIPAGLLPFAALGTWAVLLGLACTAVGVLCAGAAARELAPDTELMVPVGLVVAGATDLMWQFSTSGLETGLVFGWLGAAWWLVVRCRRTPRVDWWAAVAIGAGPLIRPDLALFGAIFAVALALVVLGRAHRGRARRHLAAIAAAAVALPVAAEILRIAYFGLLVPNTALAKSADSPWIGQGLHYAERFLEPTGIWVAVVGLVAVVADRTVAWWRARGAADAVVGAAPAIGGLLSAGYVITIGGDFMDGRFLLPAFFGLCMAGWVTPRRGVGVVAGAVLAVWAVAAMAVLRTPATPDVTALPDGIANERSIYAADAGVADPVTHQDYAHYASERLGRAARRLATRTPTPVILIDPTHVIPARVSLPVRVVLPDYSVGITGDAAGPAVYLFDQLSLANPIGSHFTLTTRGRPGHEKYVADDWLMARFGTSAEIAALPAAGRTAARAGRRALACQPLSGYLAAITGRLDLATIADNFLHVWTWTTMGYSGNPVRAAVELCGRPAPARTTTPHRGN